MQRKAELEGEIKVCNRDNWRGVLLVLLMHSHSISQDAQKSVSVYNGQYDELQKQQDALHKEDSKLRTEKV